MSQSANILIVEDEPAIREGLIDVLLFHGFKVDSTADGLDGLKKALTGNFDLILLDIMLPGMDGYEICDRLRQEDPAQAIIMLTAKTSDEDVIQGLKLGADDYVSKPFSVQQLILRIEAVLRRSKSALADARIIKLANLSVDTANLCAIGDDSDAVFTRREMDVLAYLAENNDRPVSRDELLLKIWGYSREMAIETRTVDIHIAKIRRKIEIDSKEPINLITVRGAGYRLIIDDSE